MRILERKTYRNKVSLMGLEIDNIREKNLIQNIVTAIKNGEGGWILTPNLDILRSYHVNKDLHRYFKQVTYLIPDGTPLIWASKIQGTPFHEKISGSRMIHPLTQELAKNNFRILLLGGDSGVAEKAKIILENKYPGIKICGAICPPRGFENSLSYLKSLKNTISQQKPDFVYICLSFPKGEMLIEYLKNAFPSMWFMNFGISLSYVTGDIKQAPKWLNAIGAEWIIRLIQEPKRLFERYIIHGIPFCFQLLLSAIVKRFKL